jgi:hypothetical protein
MGEQSQRFRVNSRDVVHETIDGEVIAIDLGRGSYYSLTGGAADIWSMLEAGASAEELVSAFDGGADPATVEREVRDLLERLETEALIQPGDREPAGAPPAPGAFEYRTPVFEKYEDMQDYFLLDPIHEVGSAGWPKRASA